MVDHTRRKLLTVGVGATAISETIAVAADSTKPPTRPGGNVVVQSSRADGVHTGGSRTVRIDGRYDVWVKQVGTGDIPVLTLHGGPGFNHFYLECFEDFLPQAGVRFWYYDQLGCGFSDTPDDASLWTLDRYRDEVEQVRRALGLDRFILYGHSWGGMLTLEYALKYPQHLAGIVVSNMTASVAEYVKYAAALVRQLPADAQEVIARHRATGDYEAPEYQKVLMEQVYSRHVCRLDPWPEPIQRCFRTMNAKIYNVMQGPDEFNITGNFRHWDIWARLPGIKVPALLIAARYDEMSPEQIQRMGSLIPNARVAVCPKGSHMALYDDQQAYFDALIPFLQKTYKGV
ncbi:MAG: proline iminopeptidase-family hydrolase [Steroidobacteraceae bacterium]